MKHISLLLIFMTLLAVGCSTEEQPITSEEGANLVLNTTNETILAGGGPNRVSITGNQDIRMQVRQNSNGVSGFWVDNNPYYGVGRVDAECVYFFTDETGNSSAIITGTNADGIPFAVRVRDCSEDCASMTIPSNGLSCEQLIGNPGLFPMPIEGGNVKISNGN